MSAAKRMRFEIVKAAHGCHIWNMYGRNGKLMASSVTTFRDRSAVHLIVKTLKKEVGRAKLVDV